MFSKIGMGEILLILVIAIIVLGPDKLPKIARSVGKAFGTAKKYAKQVGDEIKDYEEDLEDVANTIKDPLGLKDKESTASKSKYSGTKTDQLENVPTATQPDAAIDTVEQSPNPEEQAAQTNKNSEPNPAESTESSDSIVLPEDFDGVVEADSEEPDESAETTAKDTKRNTD